MTLYSGYRHPVDILITYFFQANCLGVGDPFSSLSGILCEEVPLFMGSSVWTRKYGCNSNSFIRGLICRSRDTVLI